MRKLPCVYFITSSGRVVQDTAGIIAQGHMSLEAFWLYSAQREAKVGLFEMQDSNQTRRWSRMEPDCEATIWRDRMALAWRLTVESGGWFKSTYCPVEGPKEPGDYSGVIQRRAFQPTESGKLKKVAAAWLDLKCVGIKH
ncbi:uncharacterized protein N7506_010718 [Penicillium brevicompactum]|uniref:uncharacterized protein n=1 Tax=Penicillium brevicompactum TaxID=5074 RepID=UPI002541935C|nr:uncharacterized protein N7506_010718 [Penicillium brevicompactum]KAJ5327616.1 hypothetical protein N7506_010718 [Penicillium brevicompactum]